MGKLTGTSSANYFTSIASATEQTSSFSNGTWGFKPNKYNSSANTNFRPVPTSSTPETIDVTNAPTTGSYTISVGAKTDTTTAADTYSYDFIVAAVTNSIDYDIVFANAASGMPSRMSGSQAGNTVTLPSTTPTMEGYKFKGWCTVSVAPNSACTGTTYQAGGTYTLAANSNNDVTLYAIWQETPPMQTFSCSSLNTGQTKELTDTRDGSIYLAGKLTDGKCWMLDNLALGSTTDTYTLTDSDTNLATGDTYTLPKSSNSSTDPAWVDSYEASYINAEYKDTIPSDSTSQTGGYKIGVYYNYCAATAEDVCTSSSTTVAAHDICPKGWKLPTGGSSGDFQTLYSRSEYNTYANYRAALRLPLSGLFLSGSPSRQGRYGYWWSTTAYNGTYRYRLLVDTSTIGPADSNRRSYGSSVRCIAQ